MFETTIAQMEDSQNWRQERIRSLLGQQQDLTNQLTRVSKEIVSLGEEVYEVREAIKVLKEQQ